MSAIFTPASKIRSAFEADILANPADLGRALIYADWLEEHGGEPALASLIRSAPVRHRTPQVVAELLGVSVLAVERAGRRADCVRGFSSCPDHQDHARESCRSHVGGAGAAALTVGREALAWMQAHEADVRAAQVAIEERERQEVERAARLQAAYKRAKRAAARLVGKPVRAFLGLSGTPYPIKIEDGDAEPALVERSYYWTTPGGRPVYHPNAYRRDITVGREWLRAQGIELPEGV